MEIDEAAVNEVGLQVSKWLKRLQNEGSEALKEMKMWDKAKLRETLDWNPVRESVAFRNLSFWMEL